jgi:hypothetical protein
VRPAADLNDGAGTVDAVEHIGRVSLEEAAIVFEDRGLVVSKLPQPQRAFGLYLGKTKVTDEGLKELAALKGLQWLNLFATRVTDSGVAELQKALPTLKVMR